jgi:hypothetical protein
MLRSLFGQFLDNRIDAVADMLDRKMAALAEKAASLKLKRK